MHLPSKRPLRNMDQAFVENRQKELEQYLQVCLTYSPHTLILTPSHSHPHTLTSPLHTQALISLPGVQSSQLVASFLTDSSDPTLFIPDSVSDKAGRQTPLLLMHRHTGTFPPNISCAPMYSDSPSIHHMHCTRGYLITLL